MRKMMMMWLEKMWKMMEKVMMMMMKMMRLRVAQEKERPRMMMMMMMRMMLKPRSKRLMCKKLLCWKSSHPSFPQLVHREEKHGHHQVESSIRVHTPNCRFCRNNQDFKALPS